MKNKSIEIQIPEPCRAGVDEFSAVPGGFHCRACSKCVVNYTHYTDRQLYELFGKKGATTTCGIFRPEQLNRVYKNRTTNAVKPGFISSLIFSGLMITAKTSEAQITETDSTQLVQTETSVDSVETTLLEENVDTNAVIKLESKIPGSVISVCEIEKFNIEELIVYGNFMIVQPPPTFLGEIIDTSKNIFAAAMGFTVFGKRPTGKTPSGRSHHNNDRPTWIESLVSRIRSRKKKK